MEWGKCVLQWLFIIRFYDVIRRRKILAEIHCFFVLFFVYTAYGHGVKIKPAQDET